MFGAVGPALAAGPDRLADVLADRDAARMLKAHHRAMLWTLREAAVRGPILATRHALIHYLHHAHAFAPVETLHAFFLNTRRELIAEEAIAQGTPSALSVEPRQVLERALLLGATGLVLVHNHPSGDPTPSAADRLFTRRLATAAECLDIRLHDHLVIARDGHAAIAVHAIVPE
ncbi:hypothetical protein GCM10011380_25900 [Sphingomonas metalli]|uniref:MPN domain-containing protein n=1 Tax=Sphingomonas metalli TaxID=1779358 RepID=A0A916T9R5_9SPHN|nr:JAB domain-containing protein [Sphingomonas metalli]GGB35327.1 hypothetical protein GCM10011380_25900 [Sphingomonas metalli]